MKIISCNIEGDNHLERIIPFFHREHPDVICVQEMFQNDVGYFEHALNMSAVFHPLAIVTQENGVRMAQKGAWGIAILSRTPNLHSAIYPYFQPESQPPELNEDDPNSVHRAILSVDVKVQDQIWRVATTHFTWSPAGNIVDEQLRDFKELSSILDSLQPDALCGDFNTPRGKEIFGTLASRFQDTVPAQVKTTVDQNLHRIPGIQLVIDSIFIQKNIRLLSSKVVDSVSDHQAIVAEIQKV